MGETAGFFEAQCSILDDAIVRLIEHHGDGLLCTILLLDAERGCVVHGAAPSMPEEYIRQLDGSRIGPEEGSPSPTRSTSSRGSYRASSSGITDHDAG
jgi:hypothetical protein